MSKKRDMQKFIRYCREKTGKSEIDMAEVAKLAKDSGWKLPQPKDPIDVLAKEFSKAARDEIECSKITGRPYRRNHALQVRQGKSGESFFVWVDINEANRNQMDKSLKLRREQMVGDGLQLSYDAEHWNNMNPTQEPIQLEFDLSFDIELRKYANDANDDAA